MRIHAASCRVIRFLQRRGPVGQMPTIFMSKMNTTAEIVLYLERGRNLDEQSVFATCRQCAAGSEFGYLLGRCKRERKRAIMAMSGKVDEKATEIYATLAGRIDDSVVQRVFNQMASAVSSGVERFHLMLQSTGGIINDGIALYNYLRCLPIDLITYNTGTVQSIAVSVFLSGKKRRAARSATFMIHKATFYSNSPTTSVQLSAATQSLKVDDDRIERILKQYIRMPDEKWDAHRFVDIFITAEEALQYGLIDEIADFSPPSGTKLINI